MGKDRQGSRAAYRRRAVRPMGETFNDTVYNLVAIIPQGRVISYGQLALMAGKPGGARMAARAVANAPHNRDLPCHRVVNQSGNLAPPEVFDGKQRDKLAAEGVVFKANGRVDMATCSWMG